MPCWLADAPESHLRHLVDDGRNSVARTESDLSSAAADGGASNCANNDLLCACMRMLAFAVCSTLRCEAGDCSALPLHAFALCVNALWLAGFDCFTFAHKLSAILEFARTKILQHCVCTCRCLRTCTAAKRNLELHDPRAKPRYVSLSRYLRRISNSCAPASRSRSRSSRCKPSPAPAADALNPLAPAPPAPPPRG